MENNKLSKVKIVISCIFVLFLIASIGCFIAFGMLIGNNETYNTGTYCGVAGFILLGLAMLGLLNPYWGLGKAFFKDFLFRKRNKK